MAWLEFIIGTDSKRIDSVATALTAQGFSELVIEDQQEFETCLDENRAYWDYIDEISSRSSRVCPIIKSIWKIPIPPAAPGWKRRLPN